MRAYKKIEFGSRMTRACVHALLLVVVGDVGKRERE